MEIREQAYAKLNLSLDVLRRRDDGYHDMRMIMQSVDLSDDVTIECVPGSGRVRARTNLGYLPADERNIAVKAAYAFFAAAGVADLDAVIGLHKRIPVCAGMGGGSADAAAVLRGLNRLLGRPMDAEALRTIALALGSDVPFCVQGGTALAEGRGELLTAVPGLPPCRIVICKPAVSISTPKLFARIRCEKLKLHPDTDGLLAALEQGDLPGAAMRMYNVFESVLPKSAGEIFDIKSELLDHRALGAVMTGTGSAVFGIFDDDRRAEAACEALRERYPECALARPTGQAQV